MEVHKWEKEICGDDKHWLVDLDTDEWIRVCVVEESGFERGSGMYEPQVYCITAIRMFASYPNSLCLDLDHEFIFPSSERPTYEQETETPFGTWMEDESNQRAFLDVIKKVVKHQMESVTTLFQQVNEI